MPKKFYAVVRGRQNGIWEQWFGPGQAWEQVKDYPGAVFKGFMTREEAVAWMAAKREQAPPMFGENSRPARPPIPRSDSPAPRNRSSSESPVVVYTDGGSLHNPGPGGYGVVRLYNGERREFSGGFRLTTNNRMELMACIVALRELTSPAPVIMHCDSKYVVDGISKGWAKRWRSRGWMRTDTEKAKNADLWAELLSLCEKVDVEFRWVKGHSGVEENERCDFLVNQEQSKRGLPPDTEYERENGSG